MQGRKPQSPKVKELAAGTAPLRLVGGSGDGDPPPPDARRIDAYAPPGWVKDKHARAEWSRRMVELARRHQYSRLFETELGRYCVAFGQYVHALQKMQRAPKRGGGAVVKSSKNVEMLSQWWVVANRAHETMRALAGDLGLNPVAQVRIAGVQFDLFGDMPQQPAPKAGGDTPKTFADLRKQGRS